MEIKQTEEMILQVLSQIEHPVYKRDLRTLGMFSRLEQTAKDTDKLRLFLKTHDKDRAKQIQLETLIRKALSTLALPQKIVIKFELDENLKAPEVENKRRLPGVKKIIAIGSGKGGVGKSTVATNLAASLHLAGYNVGIIDGDIYGPSLGKMFGINNAVQLKGDGQNRIYPHEAHGIKIVSFAFLLKSDQAVVWRGPMLGKAIEQFLFQVIWEDLDYLIFDLPPGTGDVQLSMSQFVEVDGAIVITTPQNVALQDARRAAYMFLGLKMPILGIVENMSVFHCPQCGHQAHVFSENGAEALAAELNIPHLGSLPLQQSIMLSGESGVPIALNKQELAITQAFQKLAEQVVNFTKASEQT